MHKNWVHWDMGWWSPLKYFAVYWWKIYYLICFENMIAGKSISFPLELDRWQKKWTRNKEVIANLVLKVCVFFSVHFGEWESLHYSNWLAALKTIVAVLTPVTKTGQLTKGPKGGHWIMCVCLSYRGQYSYIVFILSETCLFSELESCVHMPAGVIAELLCHLC